MPLNIMTKSFNNHPTLNALIATLIVLFTFASCTQKDTTDIILYNEATNSRTYEEIAKSGLIKAAISYSPTDYFIYKGQPMGFQYEMMNRLAKFLDVELELVITQNQEEQLQLLKEGKVDIIASNLTVSKALQEEFNFSDHYATTKLVLVQRKDKRWPVVRPDVKTAIDLIGKNLHVANIKTHINRIKNLADEIAGEIYLWDIDEKVTQFQLIEEVSQGYIDYAVADENIARLLQSKYHNIDLSVDLSLHQKISWATNLNADGLVEAMNDWLYNEKQEVDFYVMYDKFYKNHYAFNKRMNSEFLTHNTGKISMYDHLVKKYASTIDFDWRLLSSLIYQESNFRPTAESWAGAKGLMQLMPKTARSYGITNLTDPDMNLLAGTKHLKWLMKYWDEKIPDNEERTKFVLASYNVGTGHVSDARKLAEKYGKDPNIWDDNVDIYIKKKSDPKYYKDEVVKYGYCRGAEPFKYVINILDRYQQYRVMLDKEIEVAGL